MDMRDGYPGTAINGIYLFWFP